MAETSTRCRGCGKAAQAQERFCSRCGRELHNGNTPAATPASVTPTREILRKDAVDKPTASSQPARLPVLIRVGAPGAHALETVLKPGIFTLGRSQGDWVFPNDEGLSDRHAEFAVTVTPGRDWGFEVRVRDLSSQGTFVERAGSTQPERVPAGGSLVAADDVIRAGGQVFRLAARDY